VPLPDPLAVEVNMIHGTFDEAIHRQPEEPSRQQRRWRRR